MYVPFVDFWKFDGTERKITYNTVERFPQNFIESNIKHSKVSGLRQLRKLPLSKYRVLRPRREFFDRIFRSCTRSWRSESLIRAGNMYLGWVLLYVLAEYFCTKSYLSWHAYDCTNLVLSVFIAQVECSFSLS